MTHELAYYQRIRFSAKREALTALQRDVFEETWNTDLSAIEAEIEALTDPQPNPNAPVLAASRCRTTCHVLNTATSRAAVPAGNAAAT